MTIVERIICGIIAVCIFVAVVVTIAGNVASDHLTPIPAAQIAKLTACEKDQLAYRSRLATSAVTASDVSAATAECAKQPDVEARKALIADQERALREGKN